VDPNTLLGGIIGIVGALLGAVVGAVVQYWLEGKREKRRLAFETAQEKERVRREQYEAARDFHQTNQSLRRFDLAGRDLVEIDLAKADLRGANLSGADLLSANLEGADLSEADLEEATLQAAALQGTSLRGANLKGADLGRADLREARLQYADLRRADLAYANLERANLRFANLGGANLFGAILKGAVLKKTSLRGANLEGAQLAGAEVDEKTMMPGGWLDVVASSPDDAEVRGETSRAMNESKTVTGKRFFYTGSLSGSLTVYPTDQDGARRSGGTVLIPAYGVDFIREEIRKTRSIAMGACRDNPPSSSLGQRLLEWGRSPQWLSYVVPLLAEEGFCEFYKEGRRYMVRHIGV